MMDQASDVERRSTFEKIVTALSEAGGSKSSGAGVPVLGCDVTELHKFVDSRAAAAVGESELLLLAQDAATAGAPTSTVVVHSLRPEAACTMELW
jgi:hypothetical protein